MESISYPNNDFIHNNMQQVDNLEDVYLEILENAVDDSFDIFELFDEEEFIESMYLMDDIISDDDLFLESIFDDIFIVEDTHYDTKEIPPSPYIVLCSNKKEVEYNPFWGRIPSINYSQQVPSNSRLLNESMINSQLWMMNKWLKKQLNTMEPSKFYLTNQDKINQRVPNNDTQIEYGTEVKTEYDNSAQLLVYGIYSNYLNLDENRGNVYAMALEELLSLDQTLYPTSLNATINISGVSKYIQSGLGWRLNKYGDIINTTTAENHSFIVALNNLLYEQKSIFIRQDPEAAVIDATPIYQYSFNTVPLYQQRLLRRQMLLKILKESDIYKLLHISIKDLDDILYSIVFKDIQNTPRYPHLHTQHYIDLYELQSLSYDHHLYIHEMFPNIYSYIDTLDIEVLKKIHHEYPFFKTIYRELLNLDNNDQDMLYGEEEYIDEDLLDELFLIDEWAVLEGYFDDFI